jgi:hypothetical protein
MNRHTSFLLGLAAGTLIAFNWRTLAKKGIKTGIAAGRKLREVSEQAIEEMEDLAAEATEELGGRPPATEGRG